ncbi:MAG: GtrA family protein [Ruminococcaceae bacterium]|nr:GtrA family protein [Oscillospiraceae bacterium]
MKKIIDLFRQLFSFGIVGVICFFIDFGLMVLLTDCFHVWYIISGAISFTVSTIVNYLLSMAFVFVQRKAIKKQTEFIVFCIMSVIGLVFNELLMLLFVETFALHYTLSKIITTVIVMIYNFVSRKLIFEKKGAN